jgi:hypothetical protein
VKRVALVQWDQQNALDNLVLDDMYVATAHDDPAAAQRVAQAAERENYELAVRHASHR